MAPELVSSLIAVRLRFEDGRLFADGERIEGAGFYVSWYGTSQSEGQVPVADGLVHVWETQFHREEIRNVAPADLGDRYKWRDPPPHGSHPLMFVTAMPPGYTLGESNAKPVEAKEYEGTIAVFWSFETGKQVALVWQIVALRESLMDEVRRINREGMDELLPTRSGGFEYDVALSFAGEDRAYVEQVATLLKDAGVKVFYDRFEEASLWGTNLHDHLSEVYGDKARYTVMFISKHYAHKVWTNHERENAQARALRENIKCVLPARFDDTPVPGLHSSINYLSLHNREPKNLADLIIEKIKE